MGLYKSPLDGQPLQEQIIYEVNKQYGNILNGGKGIRAFVKRLRHCAKIVPTEDRVYFDNMVLYFPGLFNGITIDVESDTLKFEDNVRETKTRVIDLMEYHKCKSLKLTIRILDIKLRFLENPKVIPINRKSS